MKALALPMATNLTQSKYIIFVPKPKNYTDEQQVLDAVSLSQFLAETLPGNLYREFIKEITGEDKTRNRQ